MKDDDYVNAMIEHHGEAVRMSKELLASSKSSEIRSFAEKVIEAQSKEIKELQKFPGAKAGKSRREHLEDAMEDSK